MDQTFAQPSRKRAAPVAPVTSTSSLGGDLEAEQDNSFVLGLMHEAVQETDVATEGVIDPAFGRTVDPGMFDFAEDKTDGTTTAPTRKQQPGKLPALRPSHEGSQWQDFSNGKAFVQGSGDKSLVDPNDVAQGSLGDCYLIAGMAAVARASPEAIQKLIKDNGDGTFEVTLYIRKNSWSKPTPVTKTVDARLAIKNPDNPLYAKTGDKSAEGVEMWTALIEKTVAMHKDSYDLISGGNIGKGFNFYGATELLTGKPEGYQRTDNLDEDDALLTIGAALESGEPITVDSKELTDSEAVTREANAKNVYGNHAYAPVSVDLEARTVTLQNPWGSSHVEKLPIADFLKYYRAIRVGGKPDAQKEKKS